MEKKQDQMIHYFRNSLLAQSNRAIDFKEDLFEIITMPEFLVGRVKDETCNDFFALLNKSNKGNEKEITSTSVMICAKTLKTLVSATGKQLDNIEELTGLFFIPAKLTNKGTFSFDDGSKKLPWFPREYLQPMVEPELSVGSAKDVDEFISSNVGQAWQIKEWSEYISFIENFYDFVTHSKFTENSIRSILMNTNDMLLEDQMYMFQDNAINATYHVIKLYDSLLQNATPKALFENVLSLKEGTLKPLVSNSISSMKEHCGQMNGEYPLSPSQREAVNHFNMMTDGEILAVNGPPGTGKTTLLQTIVADLYVKRAMEETDPPIIMASSTNNQAVTNIIVSFGSIQKLGIRNLEERWITGINSFATYFPSEGKKNEAQKNGYQFTSQKGDSFVEDVDNEDNLKLSKGKILASCGAYFSQVFSSVDDCRKALHTELLYINENKNKLLALIAKAVQYNMQGESIQSYLGYLEDQITAETAKLEQVRMRATQWKTFYNNLPFGMKWLSFAKNFSNKLVQEIKLFINADELVFLKDVRDVDTIITIYGERCEKINMSIASLKENVLQVNELKYEWYTLVNQLKEHNTAFADGAFIDLDEINQNIDTKIRYISFWLSVHYYECRWANGENELSEKQKGKTFPNVLEKFYRRLSMITPCFVSTFFVLPKHFLAWDGSKSLYMYNFIDLLIVDEAGQVSPEIAVGTFALAKKAVVVGDMHQIEPVWGTDEGLDKSLAVAEGVIATADEFSTLKNYGLNTSGSSVMKVASNRCHYEKFNKRGLFLSEHRRCYDEIIDYCNRLVYGGNLEPKRGMGANDEKRAFPEWPQMGFKQISCDYSTKKSGSRINLAEATAIAKWIEEYLPTISIGYPEEDKPQNLIGIITPFKAQVACIASELKKVGCSGISVGTVHTFQGAEKKIIILSTVYGSMDGCFFIDMNKSLMNVAVSRAKDHFFVFGDSNCLQNNKTSSSGLLKAFCTEI